jgi:hypothetical protein
MQVISKQIQPAAGTGRRNLFFGPAAIFLVTGEHEMNQNPCRTCSRINEDKNHPACMNCKLRIKYIEALDQQLDFTATCAEGRNLSTHSLSFSRLHLS